MRQRLVAALTVTVVALLVATAASAQQLEIHYINVGWGNSMLIKGPDGTTVLIEAGNTGKGTSEVVPYLTSIGIPPANGLDYVIGGHQHCDHIGGLDEVIQAGYNVRIKQYNNGSSYQSSCVTGWESAAAGTTAGAPVRMPVGQVINLGGGARITAVAVAGSIIGGGTVAASNENDLSIALLIQHGGFDMLWASDLGGGSIDQACTGRSTTQVDVETAIVQAISPGGAYPMISAGGIDVLNANHHGSESSTNKNWMNYSAPAVALIGTGAGQTAGWDFPRRDVVENVLLAGTSCITVPPALVLQSEEGSPAGSLTSFMGYSVGDITITTTGQSDFTVSANGAVTQGPNEVVSAGLPMTISLDDLSAPDTIAPTASITSPANGATVSGTVNVTASASDNVGVTLVEFYLDGVLKATDSSAPYSWSWASNTAATGAHALTAKAYDAAGNSATSAAVNVTVAAAGDTTAPTVPTGVTATAGPVGSFSITVAWSASTDDVGVAGYQVWRSKSANGTYTQIATTSALSFTDSGLSREVTRYYYVKAFDAAGNVSAASVKVSARAR